MWKLYLNILSFLWQLCLLNCQDNINNSHKSKQANAPIVNYCCGYYTLMDKFLGLVPCFLLIIPLNAGQNPLLVSLVHTEKSPALNRFCSPWRWSRRSKIYPNHSQSLDSATWDLTLLPANPLKHSCGLQLCPEKTLTSQTCLCFSFVSSTVTTCCRPI